MTLVLLQPTALPTREDDLGEVTGAPAPRRLARSLASGSGTDLLDHLRALPPVLLSDTAPPPGDGRLGYTYDERLREFDSFFDVSRISEPGDGVFARSLLFGYRSLLEEGMASGTRLSWGDWSGLCAALQVMICRAAGETVPEATVVLTRPPLLRWHMDPDRRWLVGHHVFFVLTQCLIVALHSFHSALSGPDETVARRNLRLATRLLSASASAFVFAAEFRADQYHTRIRPAMEPPFVSAGFSGLLSPDHHYLVRLFAWLRPALRTLPPALVPDHRAFVRALGRVYDSHKYVCARFGGDTAPSLRTSTSSGMPGVDVIHALKLARTKIVGQP